MQSVPARSLADMENEPTESAVQQDVLAENTTTLVIWSVPFSPPRLSPFHNFTLPRYHLLDYVYTAFRHPHMEIPTEPKTIWFVPFFSACPLLMTLPYPGTSTTSTPSSAMLIWRLPLLSSPCPDSELIRIRWRWRQSHRRFRRAYIFDIWAERAFKFWITGVSTAGIPDRKEEAKFSEDNWGASTVGYIDSINKLSRRQFAHRGDRHWHCEQVKRVILVSP
ncbi:uncharacterized protein LACBIDRAFT_329449 [Laccaria bicolor S238N-H82]|uniref:Predicted protein n=1 Tax=Laccaria bicolor (strain S238N-H82 / ATCC MYA-4686) TaxID=486041 RepID=B0DI24_LACBS|nr:uncharacterized protein LACBIDRAFT_329449 [Laccaria bicolor S238N-H82]EDR05930.1 predicted protein [Laccaria bicolor S238N-H82]|eukprot:XP_001883606.1 predicted protein [Laccaria bicolor S238N-H82]